MTYEEIETLLVKLTLDLHEMADAVKVLALWLDENKPFA